MSDYPECEKLRRISDQSRACGEFLQWLMRDKGYEVTEWTKPEYSCEACGPVPEEEVYQATRLLRSHRKCRRAGSLKVDGESLVSVTPRQRVPATLNIEKLLAEFFGIDLAKVEEEKRAILAEMRRM